MKLHIYQKIIARDRHRFRVLRCGRRFGKTTLISEEIKGKVLGKPSKIAYIANNYQQARDIAWGMLKHELLGRIIDTNEQRLEIRVEPKDGGESIIFLRGWESVENLRGQAFDFLAIDEVAMMRNFWVNWYEVLRPTLTDKKKKKRRKLFVFKKRERGEKKRILGVICYVFLGPKLTDKKGEALFASTP